MRESSFLFVWVTEFVAGVRHMHDAAETDAAVTMLGICLTAFAFSVHGWHCLTHVWVPFF